MRIDITQFGGIRPSEDPRRLPPEGAQVAQDLDLRFGDFRPQRGPGAPVASVPVGTKSIFRTPSGVWLSSLTDTDYVNAQVLDTDYERVYLTGRSAYPEAWQGGEYRRLGVPAPEARPTVVQNVVDEFTSEDATEAQKAASTAVIAAVAATDTETLLGTAPPAGVGAPVAQPDPLYSSVALHLRFDALSGGRFVDTSPQQRLITHETGVTQLTDNTGPLGAAGAGCANLAGGTAGGITFSEIRRWRSEADPRWTIDAWVTSVVDLEWVSLECRDGNLREVTFITPGGQFKTLFASRYAGYFTSQLRAKRPNGNYVMTAGVPALISVQCTGSTVQVFVDGELVGNSPNPEGLELSIIGRSHWTNANAFQGKIDEVRVTLAQRYSGNFTPPTAPYSTSAVPAGFWLEHGALTGLPTSKAGDAAYLVQLSLVGGSYATTNPADEYLRDGALGGSQVTYVGAQYWAVPVASYRASGRAVVEATLASALGAVDNPATPGTPLLTSTQATSLAASIADLYDPTLSPLLPLVTTLNSRQAELRAALADATSTASVIATKITLLQSAAAAIVTFFEGLDASIQKVLTDEASDLFGSIQSAVVTRNVETRAYIVTYLTDWDERSAPSLPSDLFTGDQNDTYTVTAPAPPSGRHVVAWQLWRSNTTNTGAAFQLVVDESAPNAIMKDGVFWGFDIGNLTYTDAVLDEDLQEVCPSLTWSEPPEDLKGLVGLPNGIMAGFVGNTLWFSEPYRPYAWPQEYRKALEFEIVGLGVFGQTVVVATKGFPYYASGSDSASMSAQKVEAGQACVSKRSVVPVDGGVIYASPDGLCLANATGISLLTQGAFSKEDWQAAIANGCFGAFHDGVYYLFTA